MPAQAGYSLPGFLGGPEISVGPCVTTWAFSLRTLLYS
jgi:hypothetical protein